MPSIEKSIITIKQFIRQHTDKSLRYHNLVLWSFLADYYYIYKDVSLISHL